MDRNISDYVIKDPAFHTEELEFNSNVMRKHERFSKGNEIIRSIRKVNLAPVWQVCEPREAREEVIPNLETGGKDLQGNKRGRKWEKTHKKFDKI